MNEDARRACAAMIADSRLLEAAREATLFGREGRQTAYGLLRLLLLKFLMCTRTGITIRILSEYLVT